MHKWTWGGIKKTQLHLGINQHETEVMKGKKNMKKTPNPNRRIKCTWYSLKKDQRPLLPGLVIFLLNIHTFLRFLTQGGNFHSPQCLWAPDCRASLLQRSSPPASGSSRSVRGHNPTPLLPIFSRSLAFQLGIRANNLPLPHTSRANLASVHRK